MIFKLFLLCAIVMICAAQHQVNWNTQKTNTPRQIYTIGPRRRVGSPTTEAPDSDSESHEQSSSEEPSQKAMEEEIAPEDAKDSIQEQQIKDPKQRFTEEVSAATKAPTPPPTTEAPTPPPTTEAPTPPPTTEPPAPPPTTEPPTQPPTTKAPTPPAKPTTTIKTTATKTTYSTLRLRQPQYAKFQQDLRRFSASIYHKIITMNEGNIFFSPLSISHAMGMVNTGAKGNSSAQLRESLKMEGTDSNSIIDAGFKRVTADKFFLRKKDVVSVMASRSFFNTGFQALPEYVDTLNRYYNSIAEVIDFGNPKKSAERINSWVEEQTNGLIEDLIQEDMITPLTRLILVNALYFKAPWSTRFHDMPPADFTTPTGDVKVPYITGTIHCIRQEKDDFEYLAIPYKDMKTYFVVIMPKTDKAMMKFEKERNLDDFFKFLKRRITKDWTKEKIRLHLPAFTLEKKLDVAVVLKNMGVYDIFSKDKADFSGISEEFIYVTDFVHKAKITVNKEGTEAAAASAVGFTARLMETLDTVRINRSFIFAIYERGNILFMGKMVNPSEK